MPFRRKNDYSENRQLDSEVKKTKEPIFWQISWQIYEKANIVTNTTISIILIFILILNVSLHVKEKTISDLIPIAASFGALSLAIPLFLKDFEIQRTLWMSFLMLTILFIVSTVIGIIVILFYPSDSYEIQFTFIYVILLIISFSTRISFSLFRLKTRHKNPNSINLSIRPSEIYDFIILLALMIVTVSLGKGVATPFIILFFYSLAILLTVIFSSLTSALFNEPKRDLKHELKISIQKAVESKPEIAFSENIIIDELRNVYYQGRSNQISKTAVLEAITEMDSEINTNLPVATISSSSNHILPRWNDNFKEILFAVVPNFIFIKSALYNSNDKFLNEKFIMEYEGETFLKELSRKSNLSFELLKDNVIYLVINHLNTLKAQKMKRSYDNIYFYSYNLESLKRYMIQYRYIKQSKSVIELYKLYKFVEEQSYFSSIFFDSEYQFEVIIMFIETELRNEFSIRQPFSIEMDEIFNLINSSKQDKREQEIYDYFIDKLLIDIPNNCAFYHGVSRIITTTVRDLLSELESRQSIEKYHIAADYPHGIRYKIKGS